MTALGKLICMEASYTFYVRCYAPWVTTATRGKFLDTLWWTDRDVRETFPSGTLHWEAR